MHFHDRESTKINVCNHICFHAIIPESVSFILVDLWAHRQVVLDDQASDPAPVFSGMS